MYQRAKETVLNAHGQQWTVGKFGLDSVDRFIENYVRPQLGDPFAGLEKLLPTLPPNVASKVLREACDRRDALAMLDYDDPLVQRFLGKAAFKPDGSMDEDASVKSMNKRGLIHLFHAVLQRKHPAIDFATVCDIAEEVGYDVMAKSITDAQGRMEGNAAGPAASSSGPTGTNASAVSSIGAA